MDNTISYTVPTWALGALINGDMSGMEESDAENLAAFEERAAADAAGEGATSWHWAVPDSSESFFCHDNDVTTLGDNCIEIQLVLI